MCLGSSGAWLCCPRLAMHGEEDVAGCSRGRVGASPARPPCEVSPGEHGRAGGVVGCAQTADP